MSTEGMLGLQTVVGAAVGAGGEGAWLGHVCGVRWSQPSGSHKLDIHKASPQCESGGVFSCPHGEVPGMDTSHKQKA